MTGRGARSRGDPSARAARAVAELDDAIGEALLRWRPQGWPDADLAALGIVLAVVQGWVATARPQSPRVAGKWMQLISLLAIWAYRATGSLAPEIVFHPRNVEVWAMIANKHRSDTWRQAARSAARLVGRAAYPAGWPPEPVRSAQVPPARAYSPAEEEAYRVAAGLGGRANWVARLWVWCGANGAGLTGPEIGRAGPADLVDLGGGRLAIDVGGRNPRLVPIRSGCTPAARKAARAAAGQDKFIDSAHENSAYKIAERIVVGGLGQISLSRCRATWLTAHLLAGTPLAALRAIAGPVSARTLNPLMAAAAESLTPQEAAAQGLRP